jgi:hypothetical protein
MNQLPARNLGRGDAEARARAALLQADQYLAQHAPVAQQAVNVNPAGDWMVAAWEMVENGGVWFKESPQGRPINEWQDVVHEQVPRTLEIHIFEGDPNGVDLTLDKMADRQKQRLKTMEVDEMIATVARINEYGRNTARLKPNSMMALATHVFSSNESIDRAFNYNTIGTIPQLCRQLELVYSTEIRVKHYLDWIRTPQHHDHEDFVTFVQRVIASQQRVAWYIKQDAAIRGIIRALPLDLWTKDNAMLVTQLRELGKLGDLKELGRLYAIQANRHCFDQLISTVYVKGHHEYQGEEYERNKRKEEKKTPSDRPDPKQKQPYRPKGDRDKKDRNARADERDKKKRNRDRGDKDKETHVELITCYNCQEKGHYATDCTKPKVERPKYDKAKDKKRRGDGK